MRRPADGTAAVTWHEPYDRGAMRAHRIAKREDAARRNEITPPERRKAHRLGPLGDHGYRTGRSIRRHLKEQEQ